MFPCSLPKLPYVPMFPHIFRMFSYFFEFCSPVPQNWLMFPCSLRYFANVPLFPKTPGRPSLLGLASMAWVPMVQLWDVAATYHYYQYLRPHSVFNSPSTNKFTDIKQNPLFCRKIIISSFRVYNEIPS